jgi:hypothetical protein
MEEKSHGRQPPFKVVREFAGSRLEQQILARTYQLAVPIICKRTDAVSSSELFQPAADDAFLPQPIAQGA